MDGDVLKLEFWGRKQLRKTETLSMFVLFVMIDFPGCNIGHKGDRAYKFSLENPEKII